MPTFVRALGRGLREFRRSVREIRSAVGIDQLLEDEDEIYRTHAPLEQPSDSVSREVADNEQNETLNARVSDEASAPQADATNIPEAPRVDADLDPLSNFEALEARESKDNT